jgi:diguanylate cyclase
MLILTPMTNPVGLETPARTFVERAYRRRLFGLGLAFICVASVLFQNSAHAAVWALLVVNAFAWPQIARALALRSKDPVTIETCNLLVDSAMGGVWIALMEFNLLPSVLLALVLAIDKLNIGGWRLLVRGVAVQLAACVLAAAIHGLEFSPQTTMLDIVASLPLLVGYPLAMSLSNYSLTRTVRDQNRRLALLHRNTPIELVDALDVST